MNHNTADKEGTDVFANVMKEMDEEAVVDKLSTDMRGDAGYSSKEEFGKKVTYIPSSGHSVYKVFSDAKELFEGSAMLESEGTAIGLTFVYPNISKRVYAHILKPNRLLKMHSGTDLILEISGNAWDRMTDDERTALLHHELMHITFVEKRNGDQEIKLVDHDVKDFAAILDLYGIYYIRPGLNEED